jgi:hypothetical protein
MKLGCIINSKYECKGKLFLQLSNFDNLLVFNSLVINLKVNKATYNSFSVEDLAQIKVIPILNIIYSISKYARPKESEGSQEWWMHKYIAEDARIKAELEAKKKAEVE